MEQPLLLKLYLDNRPVSTELETFISDLAALSDKLETEICDSQAHGSFPPCVEVCRTGALEMRFPINAKIFFKRKDTGEIFRIGTQNVPEKSYFEEPYGWK